MNDLCVVIMAGGAGTRFWPASTRARPKQFLRLFGDRSLLQQSYDRVASIVGPARTIVVTAKDFVALVREQLPELPPENVVGEPERKDTAAAVALAALLVQQRFGDAVMAVLTADHLIGPVEEFQRTLSSAARAASAGGVLYTFGVEPDHPATGYGYLELGAELPTDDGVRHHALARFVEKPTREKAEGYLATGRFLWNSGMFVWRASAILDELQRHVPGHLAALRPAVAAGTADALAAAFAAVPRVSIDYAVMEKAKNVRVARARFDWSDVGSFPSLFDHLPRDDAGNAARGRLVAQDAADNLVFSEDADDLFALVGVQGLVVVRAGRRTLVAPRARAEEVKQLVARLPDDDQ
jgi:mannose-1-phosphate guanylyltransferase